MPFAEGYVLPVDKPLGWTSSDVVRKVKVLLRRLGHRKIKIGHAGTLDPLATGVLLVCIGRATKRAEELQAERKEYLAGLELGATTPSFDREHPVDRTYPFEHITRESVEEALRGMEGEQWQLPPVYSAKMIDGKRAYEYARRGDEVQMRRALVRIYEMRIEEFEPPARDSHSVQQGDLHPLDRAGFGRAARQRSLSDLSAPDPERGLLAGRHLFARGNRADIRKSPGRRKR